LQEIFFIRIEKSPFSQLKKRKTRLTILWQAIKNIRGGKENSEQQTNKKTQKNSKIHAKTIWTIMNCKKINKMCINSSKPL
jgi:hypothetical protein